MSIKKMLVMSVLSLMTFSTFASTLFKHWAPLGNANITTDASQSLFAFNNVTHTGYLGVTQNSGLTSGPIQVFTLPDGAKNWANTNFPTSFQSTFIALTINPLRKTPLYLAMMTHPTSAGGGIQVEYYDGKNWQPTNDTGLPTNFIYSFALTSDSKGTPYLAIAQNVGTIHKQNTWNTEFRFTVLAYRNNSWTLVGEPTTGTLIKSFTALHIAISNNGHVFLARENSQGKLWVDELVDNVWQPLGASTTPSTSNFTSNFDLAVNNQDIPYLTYVTNDDLMTPKVVAFNPLKKVWESVGSFSIPNQYIMTTYPSLAISSNNEPYLAFNAMDSAYSNKEGPFVLRLNKNGQWESVANAFSGLQQAISNTSLTLDSDTNPYLSFIDGFGRTSVYHLQ